MKNSVFEKRDNIGDRSRRRDVAVVKRRAGGRCRRRGCELKPKSHKFCPSHFQLTEYILHVQMNQVIRTAVPLDGQPLIIAANPRTGHNISGCRWGGIF